MNYDDFVRELARSPSHAALSPSDLEGMAKRASNMYLTQDTPLTDAVVKIAQECPGISPEQVKRIVEMSNTSTYQRLFEKGGEDRNVSFNIADPNDVLRKMNAGASAPLVKVASADYAASPRPSSSRDIEADIALCDVFGVKPPPTAAMAKTAMIDPARGQAALELLGEKEQTLKAQKKVIEMQMTPPEPIAPPDMGMLSQNMRPPMGKMASAEEAFKEVTAAMGTAFNPEVLGEYGVPQELIDQAHSRVVNHAVSGGLRGGLHGLTAGGVAGGLYGALRSGPGIGSRLMGALSGGLTAAPIVGALGGMAGLAGGISDAEKAHKREIAELIARRAAMGDDVQEKEAMAYVKSGRPDADLVANDLRTRYSRDAIKQAARANDGAYPESEPFGDLVRARQMLVKQAEDVTSASSQNEYNLKTAQADLNHHIVQHVLEGGNIGEVVHLLSGLAEPEVVKLAMEGAAPELEKRLPAWQFVHLQSGMIEYEMVKGASARVPNTNHPIAQAFAGVLKLAETQELLDQAQGEIFSLIKEADSLVAQASKTRV